MTARAIILLIPFVLAASTTAPSRSVWDGVFSGEQVDRGKRAYGSLCARCHADNLLGNDDAPALVDREFLEKWDGKTVASLVELTQKKMPTDGPGKLSRKQCTDVTAYVLSINGFPAGNSELAPDPETLGEILIRQKK
jgi:S-disulfanyl-L-cysteine oxidoreductase SoxD